ncbi:MAG: DUF2652 domain-containing protein [Gammaproteobacteria bacterium]|nr:DUF2652 domain-containing protein [Gammaproteobacteria bacterium]
MDVRRSFLIIVDISGYTRFIKLHRFAVLHAEYIINELLKSVIDRSHYPFVLNKLQGDSAFFYAVEARDEFGASSVLDQVIDLFSAFRRSEKELISECDMCFCEACRNIGKLYLKAIVHYGDVIFKTISNFEELAGEAIILSHRLVKNKINQQEYILMSQSFYILEDLAFDGSIHHGKEHCDGIGDVEVVVFQFGDVAETAPYQSTLGRRLARLLDMEVYLFRRLLGKKSERDFDNLAASQAE